MLYAVLTLSMLAAVDAAPAPAKKPGAKVTVVGDDMTVLLSDDVRAPNHATVYISGEEGLYINFSERWKDQDGVAVPLCSTCLEDVALQKLAKEAGPEGFQPWQQGHFFKVTARNDPPVLFIQPVAEPPPLASGVPQWRSSVMIPFESGAKLFLDLVAVNKADFAKQKPSKRVAVHLPESISKSFLATACRDGENDRMKAAIDEAVGQKLGNAYAFDTICRDLPAYRASDRQLTVGVRRICRDGAYVYVQFEAENLTRQELRIGAATLVDTKNGVDGDFFQMLGGELLLRRRVPKKGVAGLSIEADPAAAMSTYTLRVEEDDGLGRVIEIKNISF